MPTALLLLLLAMPARSCMEMASFRKLFPDLAPRKGDAPAEAIVVAGPRTGECLDLVERQGERYLVRREGGEPFRIASRSVYVFEPGDDYGAFLTGGSLSDSEATAARLELESRTFAEKAARSRSRRVRVLGLRRLLALSEGREAIEPWLALQEQPEAEVREAANGLLERREVPADPRLLAGLERIALAGPAEEARFAHWMLAKYPEEDRVRRAFKRLLLDPKAPAEGRDAASWFAHERFPGWYRELFENRPADPWTLSRINCRFPGPFEDAAARWGGEAAFAAVLACGDELASLDLRYDGHRERAASWLARWSPERAGELPRDRQDRLSAAASRVRSALKYQPQGPPAPVRMATEEELRESDGTSAFRPAR